MKRVELIGGPRDGEHLDIAEHVHEVKVVVRPRLPLMPFHSLRPIETARYREREDNPFEFVYDEAL